MKENKRTISLVYARYINGMDQVVETVYRGTHWKIEEIKDVTLLQIYDGDTLISSHKSWDNVAFSDERIKENIL